MMPPGREPSHSSTPAAASRHDRRRHVHRDGFGAGTTSQCLVLLAWTWVSSCTSSTVIGVDPTDGPSADADEVRLGSEGGAETAEAIDAPPVCDAPDEPLATIVLQPGREGKDTRVMSLPVAASQPAPDDEALTARAWTWSNEPAVVRGLIEFDLAAVPAAQVVSAELTLQADPSGAMPPLYFGHHALDGARNDGWLLRVMQPWQEAVVTWNMQPMTVSVPSSIAVASPSDAVYLPPSTSSGQTYVLDVTAMIDGMVNARLQNHGFLLRLAEEQQYRMLSFYSSDHPDPALRPKLVVVYRRPGC